MPQDRKYYLDYLRIFCAIAVIMIHVSTVGWVALDHDSLPWKYSNFYDSISRFAVPVFVMISGALFLEPKKNTVRHMWAKYIKRIGCAYVFWSSIYSLGLLTTGYGIEKSIYRFFEGESHLWYLFMIAGLYMITPLLSKIVDEKGNVVYFLTLSFVFSFLVPFVMQIVGICFSDQWGSVIQHIVNNLNIKFVVGYSFYYLLGYYLDNISSEKLIKKWLLFVIGFFGFGTTIILSYYCTKWDSTIAKYAFEYFSINVMLEAIFVFIGFRKLKFSFISVNSWFMKWIMMISKCCFGIYLVHPLVIKIVIRCLGETIFYKNMISVPAMVVFVFAISFVVSYILNNIPIIKKYIV